MKTTEGEWWRCDSYEIRDGCIRPKEGAKLEWYDPWPAFDGTHKLKVGQTPQAVQPGYQSLMALVHRLEYVPGNKRYPDCLTKKSQELILDWCGQYGLLGVLLSRWESISVAPQRRDGDHWFQRRYFRAFGQAVFMNETTGDVKDRTASVLIHGLNSFELRQEHPEQTWKNFFPSIGFSERNTFPYPQPYTDEFCELYGERLSDFCNAAKLLVGAMVHLSGKQHSISGDARLAREQALDTIDLLRRPVSSELALTEDGSVKPRRVAPSLLASFAEMFAQDLVDGQPTLQCICCHMPFVSPSYQAKYCSKTCRIRGQKRHLRAQIKDAKALRAQGQSIPQIAAALNQLPTTVKGWIKDKKRKGTKRGRT